MKEIYGYKYTRHLLWIIFAWVLSYMITRLGSITQENQNLDGLISFFFFALLLYFIIGSILSRNNTIEKYGIPFTWIRRSEKIVYHIIETEKVWMDELWGDCFKVRCRVYSCTDLEIKTKKEEQIILLTTNPRSDYFKIIKGNGNYSLVNFLNEKPNHDDHGLISRPESV